MNVFNRLLNTLSDRIIDAIKVEPSKVAEGVYRETLNRDTARWILGGKSYRVYTELQVGKINYRFYTKQIRLLDEKGNPVMDYVVPEEIRQEIIRYVCQSFDRDGTTYELYDGD